MNSNNDITIIRNSGRSSGRLFFFYAALLTVLFHAALLFLFKTEPKPETKKIVDSAVVSMICINSQNSERNKMIQDILDYGNPTLFAIPDEKYGYSSMVFKRKPSAYIQDMISYTLLDEDDEFRIQDFRMFSENMNENDYAPEFPAYAFILRNQKRGTGFTIEYPMALDSFNKEIAKFFAGKEQLRDKVKMLNPKNDTSIRIYESGADVMPRIRLVESSGIPELDQLAMRNILSITDDRFREKIKTGEIGLIKIKWQKAKVENDSN